MSELKPCPFCGGEAELTGFEAPEYWVWCPNCKASTDAHTCKQPAIDAWNTRAGCKNCAALNRAAGLWAKADKRARELERTCRMSPSDYYPCAEDDCMRLKVRMWTCSECEADYVGNKPNYCPNCGAKVVSE